MKTAKRREMRRRPDVCSWVLTIGCLLAGVGTLEAQPSVVRSGSDLLRVSATNAPLLELLREFAELEQVERLMVDPNARALRVDVETESVSPVDALVEILDASGTNYAVWGGKGSPFRIFVGSPDASEALIPLSPEQMEPPSPPAPPAGPGDVPGRRTIPSRPEPREERRSPGGFVTGDAALGEPPSTLEIVRVAGILTVGLLVGSALVCRTTGGVDDDFPARDQPSETPFR